MKEGLPKRYSPEPKFSERVPASMGEMLAAEKQVEEAKGILERAGITRDRFPDLFLSLEEALDTLEADVHRKLSGTVEN